MFANITAPEPPVDRSIIHHGVSTRQLLHLDEDKLQPTWGRPGMFTELFPVK